MKKLGKVVFGGAVFAAIFFLAGEIIMRLVFFDGESFGSHGGPLVERFEQDFKFNRFDGPSRGPQPNGPKSRNKTRILIQGDSITWGQGVRNEGQLFSSQLLARLKKSGASVDMAVLARPGREVDGHRQQLEQWGRELKPDVIIYQWFVNDIELEKRDRPRAWTPWRRLFFFNALKDNSYFLFFLDFSVERLISGAASSYEEYFSIQYEEDSDNWLAFEEEFREWAALAKRLTPRVIVALYPYMSLPPGEHPAVPTEIKDIHRRMYKLCRINDLVWLDLSNMLTRFDDSRTVKATLFDAHPSAEVHRAIAEALYVQLQASWPGFFQGDPIARQAAVVEPSNGEHFLDARAGVQADEEPTLPRHGTSEVQ